MGGGGCHQASSLVTSSSSPPFSHMVTLAYHWFFQRGTCEKHISNDKPLLPWLHLLGHLSHTFAPEQADWNMAKLCTYACCLGWSLGLGNWHSLLANNEPQLHCATLATTSNSRSSSPDTPCQPTEHSRLQTHSTQSPDTHGMQPNLSWVSCTADPTTLSLGMQMATSIANTRELKCSLSRSLSPHKLLFGTCVTFTCSCNCPCITACLRSGQNTMKMSLACF